jgi:hypothetical protein
MTGGHQTLLQIQNSTFCLRKIVKSPLEAKTNVPSGLLVTLDEAVYKRAGFAQKQ